MIYVSIDTETGGLDWNTHSLLEFGAIIEDTKKQLSFEEIPKFSVLLSRPDENYVGSAFALAMHHDIFVELAKKSNQRSETVIPFHTLGAQFYNWLMKNCPSLNPNQLEISEFKRIEITVAGKNFGVFDKRFLENNENFEKYIKINQRIIDPAPFYYDDMIDSGLPNLSECKLRAGLPVLSIAHRTLRDAMDVIEVLRGKMYPKI